jgi:hypothetical protein
LVVELGQEIIIAREKKLFPVENKFRSCQVVCKARISSFFVVVVVPYHTILAPLT